MHVDVSYARSEPKTGYLLGKNRKETAEARGVEPTDDTARCHPPVLKITSGVLIRYQNFYYA